MKQKIYILFDCKSEDNDKSWLYSNLEKCYPGSCTVVEIKKNLWKIESSGMIWKIRCRMTTIFQAMRAAIRANNGDIIICWEILSGLWTDMFISLLHKRVNLISMNWLSPPNKHGRYTKMQKHIINNPNAVKVTNCEATINEWKAFLDITQKNLNFTIIPDVYDNRIPFETIVYKKTYCFTGGMNNRDWLFLINLAKLLPNIQFYCIALSKDFVSYGKQVPLNLHIKFDVAPQEYYEMMKGASIVLMPLKTDKASGLINIIRSAQYGIPCISTETSATKMYYKNTEGLLLTRDYDMWKKTIEDINSMSEMEYYSMTYRFCEYIQKEFSPDNATQKIRSIINSFQNCCKEKV